MDSWSRMGLPVSSSTHAAQRHSSRSSTGSTSWVMLSPVTGSVTPSSTISKFNSSSQRIKGCAPLPPNRSLATSRTTEDASSAYCRDNGCSGWATTSGTPLSPAVAASAYSGRLMVFSMPHISLKRWRWPSPKIRCSSPPHASARSNAMYVRSFARGSSSFSAVLDSWSLSLSPWTWLNSSNASPTSFELMARTAAKSPCSSAHASLSLALKDGTGEVNEAMFSTTATEGTATRSNKSMPLTTSTKLSRCGVVTTTAQVMFKIWVKVSCTSPVPGGMSSTR
mmetsp:Transcript_58546/g.100803  ORF Transcript_58546/g.100803 Transcript_58546/m.100803 type:complete len:281 (-) Transcript_58546:690-1532(-)